MEVKCLQVKKINGVDVTQFCPTPKMRLFALSLICDPATRGKSPEEICGLIGIGMGAYGNFLKFEPYFSEWLEEARLALGGKSRKQMLEMVGLEKALSGEFNFWKAMAIKEGVISPDQLNVGAAIPSNLGAFKDMNDDQLKAAENTIMASLRGGTDARTIDLSEGPDGWGQESDTPGAPEMREGSLVLDPELGTDGERPLDELDAF